MPFPRESGILLHPTSLPGPHGTGDFGPAAFRFIDWLADAGQRLWQVMPLGPTGFGDSPYASPSAFAGNPLMISLPWLEGDGLLDAADFRDAPSFDDRAVDFERAGPFKDRLLRNAFERFKGPAGERFRLAFELFRTAEAWWLDDYALFMAVKRAHQLRGWQDWNRDIRLREDHAVRDAEATLEDEIEFNRFVQFQFQRQWLELRRYANERSIRIVGDIPIFVAEDSADVWGNREQFRLDGDGRAQFVAGVPPDPFSATGQIWGNPLYDWRRMRDEGFQWWKQRVRRTLQMVDVIRIDHFRGFAATWSVPAGAETAAEGHWERVPGGEVFSAIRGELGDVPVIIEDLGVITPDVVSLREILGFPGMNVLQFAFESGPSNVYLPHNHQTNSVVYTATHDNQTTVGWFESRPDGERQAIQRYLGRDGSDIAWDLIRLALASIANTSIVPLQDVLRLGDEARMNVPGKPFGNWAWRYRAEELSHGLAMGMQELTVAYGRGGNATPNRGANPWDYTAPGSQHPALDY